jgi:tryptophanyl-tRNA synthetase
MSKSDDSGKGIIFLGDTPDEATAKIMSATTDSFTDGIKLDNKQRPGVTNLVQIHDLLKPEAHDEVMAAADYKELKTKVAGTVRDFLIDFQNRLTVADEETILRKLESDEASMNKIAGDTLLRVQKAVGLRPA